MTFNISMPSEDIYKVIGNANDQRKANQKRREIEVRILKQKLRRMISFFNGKKKYRTEEYVARAYGQKWELRHAQGESKAGMAQIPVEFNNEVFLLEATVLRKLHTMRVARVIETLKPKRVLDVGCGNGERLLILATMFPDVHFIGLDLTKEGIETAKDIVAAGKLPENFDLVSPVSIGGKSFAGTNVDFFCGSARDMPFEDGAVDMVYTSLALEQMDLIIDDVLSEIQRVSMKWALLYEAFSEFNRGFIKRTYIDVEEYFAMSVKDLEKKVGVSIGRL